MTMVNRLPNIIGYVRVSTTNQEEKGSSPEVQKAKIIEKARELKGNLIKIYIDAAKTGTNMNRPGLKEMLARCSEKDINKLIVYDTSRLSRDTKDYLTIKALLAQYKVEVIPLTGMSSEGSDPYSKFFDEILAAVNSLHPRISGYKARLTAIEKMKFGIYPSFAPIGYLNAENKNSTCSYDKRFVTPDKTIAPFVTEAFKMYAAGNHSIFSIRQYLHGNGVKGKFGKDLQYSVVYRILSSPFYYGWMEWGGVKKMGKHTPLIDKATFEIVQEILREKGNYGIRKRKHTFLLNGFVFCQGCLRRYVAEWHFHPKFKARGGKIGYYHCSGLGKRGTGCKAPYIQIEDLEKLVADEVAKLKFKPEFIEAVKRNVQDVYGQSVSRVKAAKKAIYNRRDALDAKRRRVNKDYMDGSISADDRKMMCGELDKEALKIQKQLLDVDKIQTVDVDVIGEVLSLTQNIAQTYSKAHPALKKAYLHFFFKEFRIKDKKIAEIIYQPAIQVLQQAKTVIFSDTWLRGQDSNL